MITPGLCQMSVALGSASVLVPKPRHELLSEQNFNTCTVVPSDASISSFSASPTDSSGSLPSHSKGQKQRKSHKHKPIHRLLHFDKQFTCCDINSKHYREQPCCIQVIFADDKEFFRTDEVIMGQIVLEAAENIDTCGVYLQMEGWERIKFRQRASMTEDDLNQPTDVLDELDLTVNATISTAIPTRLPISQPHFLQSVILSLTSCVTRHRHSIPAGSRASFDFAVKLPCSKLPSSLCFASGGNNNRYFAEIVYDLTVQIFRPTASALTVTVPVKLRSCMQDVLDHVQELSVDSSVERQLVIMHSWCCWRGKEVTINANWGTAILSLKEPLHVSLESLSLPSSSDVRVKLVQELVLNVNSQHFRLVTPLVKVKFAKKDAKTVEICLLESVPPTTITAAIQCRYFLVFEVSVPWHDNIIFSSEIAIN